MARLISHDPFSRTDLFSEVVYLRSGVLEPLRAGEGCGWCGGTKVRKGDPSRRFLYQYVHESDSSRGPARSPHPKLFCSVGCFRSYDGGA